jgi:hypothetical protein
MEKVSGIFPIIKERIRQLAGTLSGGELGMLSIVRALMASPFVAACENILWHLSENDLCKISAPQGTGIDGDGSMESLRSGRATRYQDSCVSS